MGRSERCVAFSDPLSKRGALIMDTVPGRKDVLGRETDLRTNATRVY